METWEYLELQLNPDEHYYIRRVYSRQNPYRFREPPEIVYYPGTQLDLGKIATAQGWEIVSNYLNRAYLFRRRIGD